MMKPGLHGGNNVRPKTLLFTDTPVPPFGPLVNFSENVLGPFYPTTEPDPTVVICKAFHESKTYI